MTLSKQLIDFFLMVLFLAADLSMLYTLHVNFLHTDPPVDMFVKLLTDTLCARPGLRTLYDSVLALKAVRLMLFKKPQMAAATVHSSCLIWFLAARRKARCTVSSCALQPEIRWAGCPFCALC